jgi:nucleoside 2-deoxyribosyltransferase
MRIFLSGIIQGSRRGKNIHAQTYRDVLKDLLHRYAPDAEIICPIDLHPNSVDYDDDQARATFIDMVRLAQESDLVIAYLPEASMGTAVEMWEAHRRGVPVLTISPLAENWVVKLASRKIFPTVAAFEAFLAGGGLDQMGQQP